MRTVPLLALLAILLPATAAAQDTTRAVLRLLYDNPKERPGLVVLPAAGLDSVRAIVQRDLDYSDRFELIPLSSAMAVPGTGAINWAPYRAMNAVLAVELRGTAATVTARLWDVASGTMRQETTRTMDVSGTGESRLGVHG